jgi:isoleucyl-tRNA synthetase
MWHIAESMVRWLAPILSFTAEELWGHLRGSRAESVFLTTWHSLPELPPDAIDWTALIALRVDVARELERLRVADEIGGPLDAELDVWCSTAQYPRLAALGPELRFMMITSEAQVHDLGLPDLVAAAVAPPDAVPALHDDGGSVWIRVRPSTQVKCIRCWQHRADVGQSPEHPELCARCVGNLSLPGENRRYS